jgi:hypothetical protein
VSARGFAAPMCGKAPPFRQTHFSNQARLRLDHCEAQPRQINPESLRKGKAFPHIKAAELQSFA